MDLEDDAFHMLDVNSSSPPRRLLFQPEGGGKALRVINKNLCQALNWFSIRPFCDCLVEEGYLRRAVIVVYYCKLFISSFLLLLL